MKLMLDIVVHSPSGFAPIYASVVKNVARQTTDCRAAYRSCGAKYFASLQANEASSHPDPEVFLLATFCY